MIGFVKGLNDMFKCFKWALFKSTLLNETKFTFDNVSDNNVFRVEYNRLY